MYKNCCWPKIHSSYLKRNKEIILEMIYSREFILEPWSGNTDLGYDQIPNFNVGAVVSWSLIVLQNKDIPKPRQV